MIVKCPRSKRSPSCLAVALLGAASLLSIKSTLWVGGAFVTSGKLLRSCRSPTSALRALPPKRWQKGLDTAILDIDATPAERLEGLREALTSPGDVAESVARAAQVLASKGFRKGHPEAIDAIFPQGTIARADIEGLAAVARQAPEVLESLQAARRRSASGDASSKRPAEESGGPDASQVIENLRSLLLSQEKQEEVAEEIRNSLRSTPTNLEEPAYSVNFTGSDFEVRLYEPFTVSTYRMNGPSNGTNSFNANGFNTLAGYLFGDNSESRAMKMTMPVEISYTSSEDKAMSFVMPKDDVELGLPEPRTSEVELQTVSERLVAVRRFPGIATDEEVSRQVGKLLDSLSASNEFVPVEAKEYSVLQYNPPYTIPWRRRNEIALVVTRIAEAATPDEEEEDVEVEEEDEDAAAQSGGLETSEVQAEDRQESGNLPKPLQSLQGNA
mmetsp:Transcript_6376/g.13936  ORF Transcript_6376/g.13936 Transcript_6376/m.13936 type:complete len:443 (-) Transcript_6376:205-1533(-)